MIPQLNEPIIRDEQGNWKSLALWEKEQEIKKAEDDKWVGFALLAGFAIAVVVLLIMACAFGP
jgi:hypothetical protein